MAERTASDRAMGGHRITAALGITLLAAFGATPLGCDVVGTGTPCRDIPQGGCPLQYGVSCDDPACAAVYACREGEWILRNECGRDAATPEASVAVLNDAARDRYASTPGCPDLQSPDCALETALACASDPTCCGCEDLFECKNGGWEFWGVCTPDGPKER